MTGAAPLLPLTGGPPAKVVRYRFPAVDQRDGADPSWANTMDALRAPQARPEAVGVAQGVPHPTGCL